MDIASNEFVQIIEPKIASNSISNRLATAGTLFQTVACISLAAGIYSNSTEQGLQKAIVSESGAKLVASIGFLYGGILDHRVAMQEIRIKNPAASAATKESLKESISKNAGWAKRLNLGSAIIFSGFDLYHAYDEAYNKGNTMMSVLYVVSAGAGFGAVYAVGVGGTVAVFGASVSWTGIGLVLFVIAIGVGFLITKLTLSPIQEWIENSIWGIDSLHLSHKEEIEAYKIAINSITESESSDDKQSTSTRAATSDGSVNSTNNQKSTTNINTDIPDYQYMDAKDYEPLDYQDIEYDSTLSNVDLDPETRRNVELSQQRRQDEQNSEWPTNSDQDDYKPMGIPKTQQTNGVFSVLGANDGKAPGTGISAKTRKELEQARQKKADQVKSFEKVNDDLNIYTKKLNEQNKKMAELQNKLAELRKE